MAVVFCMCLLPIGLAVGMATDYSSATNSRGTMQNALDAATLSLSSLPDTMTNPQRETKLKEFYAGNGGTGTAKLVSFSISAIGEVDAVATAAYSMPTKFMQLAQVKNVGIAVRTEMHKEPTLIAAKFEIEKASGWWNKTMYLKGRKYGEATPNNLMRIAYAYNGSGESKGYGTTSVYKVTTNAQGVQSETLIQQQLCNTIKTTVTGSGSNKKTSTVTSGSAGDVLTAAQMAQQAASITPITSGSGSTTYSTICYSRPNLTTDKFVDVSTMEDIYLQMDVPSGNPNILKTNDAATAHYLYVDGIEIVNNGKSVDIFSVVPCGDTSHQAWEDGGSTLPAPVSNADFYYSVTGKCDYSQRPIGISLTK